MEKSIYEVYVPMVDQAQCDRMKQVCIDNGLPYWKISFAFRFSKPSHVFGYDSGSKTFFVWSVDDEEDSIQVTEKKFLQLLSNHLELLTNKE